MGILDVLIILLVLSWFGGLTFSIGGGLIHILLVIALVVLIARIMGFAV